LVRSVSTGVPRRDRVVDDGHEGGPPAGLPHGCSLIGAEQLGEAVGPGGGEVVVAGDLAGDGGSQAPSDPPPQGGRVVVVG
jgi:hypothetical protein